MPRSILIFSFLLLKAPLIAYTQSQESSANSIGAFFQDGTLPASCNVHIGVDWYGGDMIPNAFERIDSPGGCCALCREQLGCRAWVWRNNVRNCWLKHTVVTPPLPCPECVSGIFHHVTPEFCNPQEGTGWDGPDLEVRIGTTLGSCCDACNQNPNCTRWTFRNTTNLRCFLKRGDARETNCTSCVSGVNEENIRLNEDTCNAVEGVDWFGNDINRRPLISTRAADCCAICQFTRRCRAWLYRRSLQHCYLKRTVGSTSECPDCIGGLIE